MTMLCNCGSGAAIVEESIGHTDEHLHTLPLNHDADLLQVSSLLQINYLHVSANPMYH